MNRQAEQMFSTLQPPDPQSVLRRRVLVAARAALTDERAPDFWDRLWTSRPARLAWAAAVLGLAVGHLALSGRDPRQPAETALPVASIAVKHSELAELAVLGRLTTELAGWEIAAARNDERVGRKEPS